MLNARARRLRRGPTDAEMRLWKSLRGRRLTGYKFRRQHPIGAFIADFACTKHHLIVEIDGGQHACNRMDLHRTVWLEGQGWQVIRFWNNEVLANTEGVVDTILRILRSR